MMKFEIKKIFYFMLVFFVVISVPAVCDAANKETVSLKNFKKLVVLENGRKKPLDTYAQNLLKQFSGESEYGKEAAVNWLARVLFTPKNSFEDKVFLITHPDVLSSIRVPQTEKGRGRYSFSQLREGIPKLRELAFSASKIEGENRTLVETEIIILYNKLNLFRQLIAEFQFAIPHSDFLVRENETKKYLGFPETKNVYSFIDMLNKIRPIRDLVSKLNDEEKESWTGVEKDVFRISNMIERWTRYYRNLPLKIIPDIQKETEKWLNPWDLLFIGFAHGSPVPEEINLLSEFIEAYIVGDQMKFDAAVGSFNKLVSQNSKEKLSDKRISLEIFYNGFNPFYKAEFFYGFSLFFLILSYIVLKKWSFRLSYSLLILGAGIHTSGIIFRMIIRNRPPVTNLYETFVFTAWIAVILGLILEIFKKRNIGILTGSFSGLAMLLIASKYALEGDTMGMLSAVLDSNFWLAVHIITITVGFAGIIISGVIGHVFVFQRIFKPDRKGLLNNSIQAIYSTQAFGLIFTFIGTVLGGMWADQSWGRFWGWDPKENGALLIILWSVMLFHARLTKWMSALGFALGSIGGIIAVVLTWFGVNLLGIGLHSYGFTSGIAMTLTLFLTIEIVFITGAYIYLNRNKRG